jgi:hypothetical protein
MLNSLFGFSMLYNTDALGLRHSYAGIAMGLAVFWDSQTYMNQIGLGKERTHSVMADTHIRVLPTQAPLSASSQIPGRLNDDTAIGRAGPADMTLSSEF